MSSPAGSFDPGLGTHIPAILREMRAMDRRRFVPSSDGLEGRTMLSTLGINQTTTPNLALTQPNTPAQKAVRIERLPFFLRSLQPGRFLPTSVLTPLQRDMTAVEGQLHSPPSPALEAFNIVVRDVTPHATLSSEDARKLNESFGKVLQAAGATPQAEANLKADLNAIARIDANDVNPVILATNDYSVILQTTLAIGRPIRTPAAPVLAKSDIVSKDGLVTNVRQPHLVGTYDPDATIQIIDDNGNVLGSGVVGKIGRYSVPFQTSLTDGMHTVRVQAQDTGEFSSVSPPFTFRVLTKAPKIKASTDHSQGTLSLKT